MLGSRAPIGPKYTAIVCNGGYRASGLSSTGGSYQLYDYNKEPEILTAELWPELLSGSALCRGWDGPWADMDPTLRTSWEATPLETAMPQTRALVLKEWLFGEQLFIKVCLVSQVDHQ